MSYRSSSVLARADDGEHLDLATARGVTPQGVIENPVFFRGIVPRADVLAGGLLAVADVAATRYADAGLAQRVAALDPVVTASGDRLRFESFSACNGVYARFDLLPDGIGSSEVGFGTTNVDVNQPLRTALARIGRTDVLHLAVGRDELRASTLADGAHVERKVALPDRWVRGFAEVPGLTSAMHPVGDLAGSAVVRLFADLPRTLPPGPDLHVRFGSSGSSVATRAVPGSVPLRGAVRLRGTERLLRYATRVRAFTHDNGTTAWLTDVPGGRLTLALSPDPFRGFSGEGTLLLHLTDEEAESHGRRLLASLQWSAVVDPAALARATGLNGRQVERGLAWLSASGRIGYDLDEGAWFHRELPVETDKVLHRNPRLRAAQDVVRDGGVAAGSAGRWQVQGTLQEYVVTGVDGGGLRCTCPWDSEYAGNRGPCKHILAVVISLRS